jgi:hypothetical protein
MQVATSLQNVELAYVQLTRIPDNALQSHPSLVSLAISYSPSLTSIGENAFKNIPSLESLKFGAWISDIGDEAFAASHVSTNKSLLIDLVGNNLNDHTIPEGAFSGINRKADLNISGNTYLFLEESTYGAFLRENPSHIIHSDTMCFDERNDWARDRYAETQWIDCY